MPKSMHSPEHRALCKRLAELREKKGLTQRALAERLSVVPSWVANVELGERRIDLVELIWFCEALELDPTRTIKQLVSDIQ